MRNEYFTAANLEMEDRTNQRWELHGENGLKLSD